MSAGDAVSVAAALGPELVAWRRRLHVDPELSFQEHETSAWVEATLRDFALEPVRPTATSVVARIVGGRPGPTIAARADIDALPILEENTFDFVSTRPGVAPTLMSILDTGEVAVMPGPELATADMFEVTPPAGSDFPNHHPRFTVDEAALSIGTAVLIRSILALQAGEH